MACKYYIKGKESRLYTDLYGYFDNTAPERKSVEEVYKILKEHRIATRVRGEVFVTQGNSVQPKLKEIDRINRKYPGLIETEFLKNTRPNSFSPKNKLYSLAINEVVLKSIPNEGAANSALDYKNQYELDKFMREVQAPLSAFEQDYLLDEQARSENKSDQSRISEMADEDMAIAQKKANHLKDSFAKAGIDVEVIFDEELDVLGQVDSKEDGKSAVIRLNPNSIKEDTTIHEFGHIYIDLLGISDPTVATAINELRNTDLYAKVAQSYPDLKGEALDKEVLATAIGQEGAKIVRKNPSRLQVLLNRLYRAFAKMLNSAGIDATPNSAAQLAREMLSGDLRVANMSNPISPYSQQSRDMEKLNSVLNDAKTRVATEIAEIKNLPEAEQSDKLDRLNRVEATLANVKKVEDFYAFVSSAASAMDNARSTYEKIMALPESERAQPKNMNAMYEVKKTLDSFDTVKSIRNLLKAKQKAGKILQPDIPRFDTIQERTAAILDDAEFLNEQFMEDLIPIMADVLLPFHNTELDPKIQALIDNVQEHKRIAFNSRELKRDPQYIDLKKRRDNNTITQEQFEEAALKRNIELLKNKQILGRDDIIRAMRAAHKDKSAASYLFDPIMYSSEPLIQMFAKSVKAAEFRKNDMTLDFKYNLKQEYDVFAEGMDESNVAELNEALLEEVEMDQFNFETKEKSKIKALSLVQPLLVQKYNENQREMYIELGDKYNKPKRKDYESEQGYESAKREWNKGSSKRKYDADVNKWLKENTEPIDGWKDKMSEINRQLSKAKTLQKEAERLGKAEAASMQDIKMQKLRQKLNYNVITVDGISVPRGEWIRPKKSKYTNPKYEAIQADPKKKRYYDFMLKEFQAGQKMVGINRFSKNTWDDFSYIMPSIRKQEFDRAREQGLISSTKDMLEEGFSTQTTDTQFGLYNEKSGELKKSVPVYYTGLEESKNVSRDIASSIYGFRHMAHNFVAKSDIVGQVMLFRDILKNRDTIKIDAAGVEYINNIAKQIGIKMPVKEPGDSYTYKHVDEFIDMIMFGQSEFKAEFNIGNKRYSANKVSGTLNAYMALNTLSFNFLQGANQVILDNMSMIGESVAGEFATTKDLAWAKAEYWKNGASISDIGKFAPETKMGKALEYFDGMTEFTDTEGNKIVGGKARKALSKDNLMFIQQGAEHELSATRMLALMKNMEGKLKDADGNVIMNEEGNPANLWDLLVVDKKGKMSVDPRVANFNKADFINLLQGLSRRTNQTKGSFDRSLLNRRWYGKLAMLFRNWMIPGIRRRYGHGGFTGSTLQVDEELGTVTQGMYISFYNLIAESYQNKQVPMTTYRTMTEMEKRNVKRTLVELSSLAASIALIAALSNLDDDEETWVSNFMLYQAKRYKMEMLQWTPLVGTKEAFRILKSPTATARPVEQGIALIEQVMFRELPHLVGIPVDESKIYYQRRSGRYNKGDRKLRKKINDLIPVLRGLQKSQTPEEAAKWFGTLE